MTRTHDLLITNQLLYRLSYTSKMNLQEIVYHIFSLTSTEISPISGINWKIFGGVKLMGGRYEGTAVSHVPNAYLVIPAGQRPRSLPPWPDGLFLEKCSLPQG